MKVADEDSSISRDLQNNSSRDIYPVNPNYSNEPGVNEIIMKAELKKFKNLMDMRTKRKNNLIIGDMKRVFPVNKLADGSAQTVDLNAHEFRDSMIKLNPRLFKVYEGILGRKKRSSV